MEEWININGTNGKYKISSKGRVMSTAYGKETILKHSVTEDGNITVVIRMDGQSKTVRVKNLVASHFLPNPNNYAFVEHKDMNRLNCELSNLEWVEKVQNVQKMKSDVFDTDNEQWAVIPNTNGLYKVSTLGNIYSLKRGKFIKTTKPKVGYSSFSISVGSHTKLGVVHKLVAEAFIPNPNNYKYVDHIDGDRFNNNVNNLKWCSCKQNANNPITIERKKLNCNGRPIAVAQKLNGEVIATYPSMTQAAKQNNLLVNRLRLCCLNLAKTYNGYEWSFLD